MNTKFKPISFFVLIALLIPLSVMPLQQVSARAYCDAAQFVSDVTVPDGTRFAGGTTFTKTWRLKNVGTCTWNTKYNLVFASGQQMGGPAAVSLPNDVAPGQTVDVSVNLTAPTTPGTYRGFWKLSNASGVVFGIGSTASSAFWVDITVSPYYITAYDFYAEACNAQWMYEGGPIACPLNPAKILYGYVIKQDNPVLETGFAAGAPGLFVVPQLKYNGLVRGVYPIMDIFPGDHFQAGIACASGATGCYVRFLLEARDANANLGTIWKTLEKFDGRTQFVDIDLSPISWKKNINLVLTVSAYGDASGDQAVWVAPKLLRPVSTVPITPTATVPPPPTPTPGPVACTDRATFVSDVTVPDNTIFAPNTAFVKTWRLRNSGTCTWTTGYSLAFSSGEKMSGPDAVPFTTTVVPNQTVDLSVNLVAPATTGTFRGNWMLKNPSGTFFGIGTNATSAFWVQIVSSGTPVTPPATLTPAVTTPTATSVVPTTTPPTATPVTPTSTTPIPPPTATFTSVPSSTGFDFYANACAAQWFSGAGVLPCPGADGDARGFVLKQSAPKLETGTTSSQPGLLMAPQNMTDGYIQAVFPAYTVQSGDRFQSTVNCEFNAVDCFVIFRLDYQVGSNAIQTYWTFAERYDGFTYNADLDLAPLAGQNVKFILTVLANGSASGDRALWVAPKIAHP